MYNARLASILIYAVVGWSCLLAIHWSQAWWSVLILPLFFFGFVPLFDLAIGERDLDGPGDPDSRWYDYFLYLQIPVHFSLFVGAIWVATTSTLAWGWDAAVAISFGLLNGQCALIAHEFAHKLGRVKRLSAQASLAVIGMGHFLVEHVRGHHIHVATPEDCASARLGESIYHFALRDLPGEVRGGLMREGQRLRRSGRAPWSSGNTILQGYAVSAAIAAGLCLALGWAALPWIALHHLSAWFTLTLVTYIEHYGLQRERRPDGRYEHVSAIHSWNTNAGLSNLLLLNVQRHSFHHAHPMAPYQMLEDDVSGPRLPTGYFGMIVLAMIPPLWFRVMDRRAIKAMAGRATRLHLGPAPGKRVRALVAAAPSREAAAG
jgi:alkane 1-monooxygenase